MRDPHPFTRRRWLSLGAGFPAALWVAVACDEKQFACDQVVGLTPQGIGVRQNLAYADRSKNPEQNCANCQQWVPAPASGHCGGCKVMPGPVHPQGFCKVWVKQG
jgi:hypothetical protein